MSSEKVSNAPPNLNSEEELSVTVVEADEPHQVLPDGGDELLGWHVTAQVNTHMGRRAVLLSDPCVGEPPIPEVIKVISHEYLHDILEQEVSPRASKCLDNIVEDGDFVVERDENNIRNERELQDRFKDKYGERFSDI